MVDTAELAIIIRAQDQISGVLDRVQSKASSLGGQMRNVLRVGAIAAGAGLGVAAVALTSFVREAMEAERITAQTNAVLESTRGVSGMTAQSVSALANELAAVIPIDDELIQKTENMLLTFTNVGQRVFPQATEAALDMSIALGEDSVSSAMRLGRALNDPIAGVSALRRVGVQLSDAQEEQIRSFMAVNDIASAQGVILGELQTEFGNSARAAGETFAGRMEILHTQIGNVKEAIGMALIPILTEAATVFAAFLANHQEDIQRIAEAIAGRLTDAIQGVVSFIRDNQATIETFVDAFVLGLQTLQPIVVELFEFISSHRGVLIALAIALGVVVIAIAPIPVAIIGIILAIGLLRDNWDMIKAKTIEVWNTIAAFIDEKLGYIDEAIVSVVTGIVSFFREHWEMMRAIVFDQLEFIRIIVVGYFNILRGIFLFAWAVIHGDWSGAWDELKGLVSTVFNLIKDIIINRLTFIRDVFVFGWEVIKGVLVAALTLMGGAVIYSIAGIVGWFQGMPGRILSAVGDLGRLLYDAGRQVVQGLIDGINSLIPSIPDLSPGFNVPGVPLFASGTRNFTGGLAVVGERGPELVSLPRGSNVYSNAELRGMGGNVYVTGPVYITGDAEAALLALGLNA